MPAKSFLHFILAYFVVQTGNLNTYAVEDVGYPKEFYDACANGNLEKVQEYLEIDSSFAKASTPDGETCIHLTAISKSFEVAKLMIDNEVDVNHRVTHDHGLRMMLLSWHTYSGNVDIVKLLIDNGADVNADFDLDTFTKVTATDIAERLASDTDSTSEPNIFKKTLDVLIDNGGKKFSEL